jgi:flagellar assembly protein FliH
MEGYDTWNAPAMGGGGHMTAKQLEEVQKQAYDEAYARGLEEGKKAMQARGARLDALMVALNTPFEELDQQVEDELVNLTIAIVRQLVRRELRTDPGQVVAVVREAVAALPVVARNIRLHLHPEDAQLVREALSVSENEKHWRIVDDPVLTRGGCRVVTENSQVDATLETRLAQIVSSVFGGERAEDGESDKES